MIYIVYCIYTVYTDNINIKVKYCINISIINFLRGYTINVFYHKLIITKLIIPNTELIANFTPIFVIL